MPRISAVCSARSFPLCTMLAGVKSEPTAGRGEGAHVPHPLGREGPAGIDGVVDRLAVLDQQELHCGQSIARLGTGSRVKNGAPFGAPFECQFAVSN